MFSYATHKEELIWSDKILCKALSRWQPVRTCREALRIAIEVECNMALCSVRYTPAGHSSWQALWITYRQSALSVYIQTVAADAVGDGSDGPRSTASGLRQRGKDAFLPGR